MSAEHQTQNHHEECTIAIVGGGLGGLALAIGLLKQGVKVHIFEAAAVFSEIGAGVAFGPNTLRALKLIDEAILRGYLKHATYNENIERRDTFMSLRYGIDQPANGKNAGDLIFNVEEREERYKVPGSRTRSCIHRARFLDELVALIPAEITSFEKSLDWVEQPTGKQYLVLHFSDGSNARVAAIVGCDGIKSRVRDAVFKTKAKPTFTGEYAYRAMVPRERIRTVIGDELALNGQIYCGHGGYIVTYPVEHGAYTNIVAVRQRIGSTWSENQWTVPSTREEMLKDFEEWYPPLINLIVAAPKHEKWALFDMQHSESYYKGSICLMGDSAHATTPHLGAGAGMAMEDAFILSNLMGAVKESGDWEKAFRAFDTVRRPRTQRLVELSRLAGLAYEFLDGTNDEATLESGVDSKYRWIWHEDLELQLSTAMLLLE